jgi:hypothetical protein
MCSINCSGGCPECAPEDHIKALITILADVRYSLLARVYDDRNPRELYDTEIDKLTKELDFYRRIGYQPYA